MAKKIKKKVDLDKIAQGVRLMLEGMGEDPEREGLQKTPERVADFYAELVGSYYDDLAVSGDRLQFKQRLVVSTPHV